jgi:hypothetical protein
MARWPPSTGLCEHAGVCVGRPRLTVEEGVVGDPETTTDQNQTGDATSEALWRRTAAAAEAGGAAGELVLDALPGFLGVGGGHGGGEWASAWVRGCECGDGGDGEAKATRWLCSCRLDW